jgi:ribose-phosphate pyrophosphokinase
MPTFEIFETSGTKTYSPTYSSFVFSGGELQIKLDEKFLSYRFEVLHIRGDVHNAQALFELALLVDALRRQYAMLTELHLICPYLPYARQDRVCAPGEALSLKVLANFINGLNFTTVSVWDVHSDVSLALIDRVINFEPEIFLRRAQIDWTNTVVVIPDGGALKKVFNVAKAFQTPYIVAEKHRNPENGEITETKVHLAPLSVADMGKEFLVVDDICDGGRTFITLAQILRKKIPNLSKLSLYITHGIFSQGLTPLLKDFDRIYVANCFLEPDDGPDWEKVTILTKESTL